MNAQSSEFFAAPSQRLGRLIELIKLLCTEALSAPAIVDRLSAYYPPGASGSRRVRADIRQLPALGFGIEVIHAPHRYVLVHNPLLSVGLNGEQIDSLATFRLVRYWPDAIAMEVPAFDTPGIVNLVQQSRVAGVVLLAAAKAGLLVIEIAPTRAKVALTGNGKADKAAMMAACPRRARNPFDEHAADVLGVVRAAFDPTVHPPRPKKERKLAKPGKARKPRVPGVRALVEDIPRQSTRKRVAYDLCRHGGFMYLVAIMDWCSRFTRADHRA